MVSINPVKNDSVTNDSVTKNIFNNYSDRDNHRNHQASAQETRTYSS